MGQLQITRSWAELGPRYGIYLRLLEGLPQDSFDHEAIPGMRSPTELVVHVSGTVVRDIVRGIASGTIHTGEPSEAEIVESLKSKEEVLSFSKECWAQADRAASEIDEARLAATVRSPWESELTGAGWLAVVLDEFMHHRGQLYAFSRALSVAPPSMWRFDENELAFRPE